ncbi:MAG: hypothetical protein GX787_08265 [Tissierellia bacterium]|nr:hypothetical protein [Tissierellia bacterium]
MRKEKDILKMLDRLEIADNTAWEMHREIMRNDGKPNNLLNVVLDRMNYLEVVKNVLNWVIEDDEGYIDLD